MSPSPSGSRRPSSPSVFFGRIALTSSASLPALPSRVTRDQRQTMTVGGDQAHRIRAKHEQRAVQKIARVFAGDRKLRLRDHFLERRARQRRARCAARLGQRRKILARQRLHPRVEPIGRDLHAAFVLGDANVGLRQRLDDLVELLRRQRQRSALCDRRRAFAAQANFEIGGKKTHLVAFGFHQHVRQNRNRVLSLDDSLKKLQFSQKVVLADDKFHGCADLEKGGGLAPAIP